MILNLDTENGVLSIEEGSIISITTKGTDLTLQYQKTDSGNPFQALLTGSIDAIEAASSTLIKLTSTFGGELLISIDRIFNIDDRTDFRRINYNANGSDARPFDVTETTEEIQVKVAEKSGQTVYLFVDSDATANTITLDAAVGDVTAEFPVGKGFTLSGSDIDGAYITISSAFAGSTVITVADVALDTQSGSLF